MNPVAPQSESPEPDDFSNGITMIPKYRETPKPEQAAAFGEAIDALFTAVKRRSSKSVGGCLPIPFVLEGVSLEQQDLILKKFWQLQSERDHFRDLIFSLKKGFVPPELVDYVRIIPPEDGS